jgi:hypothetical protein
VIHPVGKEDDVKDLVLRVGDEIVEARIHDRFSGTLPKALRLRLKAILRQTIAE